MIMKQNISNDNKDLNKKIDLALSKKNNINNNKKLIDKSFSSALSRVATELLAGLIIGAGIGLMLDKSKFINLIDFC